MLRALVTAVLLTGAAVHFLGAPPDVALGYTLAVSLTLWFTWPLVRCTARLMRRARRRRNPRRTAPNLRVPAPQLTQINHHHHYYSGFPPAAAPARPDYTLSALPQRSRQQMAHDAIYDTIDLDTD